MTNPEQLQPKISNISVEKRQEILNEVGTIQDAFDTVGFGAVLHKDIAAQGWQTRQAFSLRNGEINDSTLELIQELKEEGNKVSIGLPHNNIPPDARVLLYQ